MSAQDGKAEPCNGDYQAYLKRYKEYRERQNFYYPQKRQLTLEEFKVWDAKWQANYRKRWTELTAWMKEHS